MKAMDEAMKRRIETGTEYVDVLDVETGEAVTEVPEKVNIALGAYWDLAVSMGVRNIMQIKCWACGTLLAISPVVQSLLKRKPELIVICPACQDNLQKMLRERSRSKR
jgi:hypothetical protein